MRDVQLPTIPWEKFKEEEIHSIIQKACEENGWEVYNLHKIQRNAEHGADLIITKNDGSKLAIAVKVKPKSGDRTQLIDLSGRSEKEKMYIYINDPTPDFKKEIEKYTNQIKFFNKDKLSEWIFELDPYIYSSLVIDSHNFSLKLCEIKKSLMEFFYESTQKRKGKIKPKWIQLNEELLRILWRLKDETASLNKTFRALQFMFEFVEDKKPEPERDIIFLNGFVNVLKSLYTSLVFIHKLVNKLWEENKNFIVYVIQKTQDRSNWKGILAIEIGLPVFSEIEAHDEENKQLMKRISELSGTSMRDILSSEERYNILYSITENCRIFANFIDCIESFVDDLFSYGIFNEYHTYVLYKELEDNTPNW